MTKTNAASIDMSAWARPSGRRRRRWRAGAGTRSYGPHRGDDARRRAARLRAATQASAATTAGPARQKGLEPLRQHLANLAWHGTTADGLYDAGDVVCAGDALERGTGRLRAALADLMRSGHARHRARRRARDRLGVLPGLAPALQRRPAPASGSASSTSTRTSTCASPGSPREAVRARRSCRLPKRARRPGSTLVPLPRAQRAGEHAGTVQRAPRPGVRLRARRGHRATPRVGCSRCGASLPAAVQSTARSASTCCRLRKPRA